MSTKQNLVIKHLKFTHREMPCNVKFPEGSKFSIIKSHFLKIKKEFTGYEFVFYADGSVASLDSTIKNNPENDIETIIISLRIPIQIRIHSDTIPLVVPEHYLWKHVKQILVKRDKIPRYTKTRLMYRNEELPDNKSIMDSKVPVNALIEAIILVPKPKTPPNEKKTKPQMDLPQEAKSLIDMGFELIPALVALRITEGVPDAAANLILNESFVYSSGVSIAKKLIEMGYSINQSVDAAVRSTSLENALQIIIGNGEDKKEKFSPSFLSKIQEFDTEIGKIQITNEAFLRIAHELGINLDDDFDAIYEHMVQKTSELTEPTEKYFKALCILDDHQPKLCIFRHLKALAYYLGSDSFTEKIKEIEKMGSLTGRTRGFGRILEYLEESQTAELHSILQNSGSDPRPFLRKAFEFTGNPEIYVRPQYVLAEVGVPPCQFFITNSDLKAAAAEVGVTIMNDTLHESLKWMFDLMRLYGPVEDDQAYQILFEIDFSIAQFFSELIADDSMPNEEVEELINYAESVESYLDDVSEPCAEFRQVADEYLDSGDLDIEDVMTILSYTGYQKEAVSFIYEM